MSNLQMNSKLSAQVTNAFWADECTIVDFLDIFLLWQRLAFLWLLVNSNKENGWISFYLKIN